MEKKFHYGGQAVIEGVMIRGKKYMVTAVRKPDNELVIDKKPLSKLYTGWMRKTPFLRGIVVLIESLVFGMQTLMYSANIALDEEDQAPSSMWWIWLVLLASVGVSVAIFFLTPLFLTNLLNIQSSILFNLVEGVIRLAMFLLYLVLVSLMPDIRRVFAYHGAEHKSVHAYEAGVELVPENIKGFSKAHIRCGGSFLFIVFMIAILVFSLVGKQVLWIMVLSRILLMPVIAALGYEFIHFAAEHTDNIIIRIISAPGLWIQALTTKEPDEQQLEVGIAAIKAAVEADQEIPAEPETAVETSA